MHLPNLTHEANGIPSEVTLPSRPALSSGRNGCDHCHHAAVPQQKELGWGEKFKMNRLRTILDAASHQCPRSSIRFSKGEVRETCQTGTSIS